MAPVSLLPCGAAGDTSAQLRVLLPALSLTFLSATVILALIPQAGKHLAPSSTAVPKHHQGDAQPQGLQCPCEVVSKLDAHPGAQTHRSWVGSTHKEGVRVQEGLSSCGGGLAPQCGSDQWRSKGDSDPFEGGLRGIGGAQAHGWGCEKGSAPWRG